jgi:hypothetical protein
VVPADHRWSKKSAVRLTSLKRTFYHTGKGFRDPYLLKNSLSSKGMGLRDFSIAATLGSTTSVIQGIKSGIGVSILSEIAVADDVKSNVLASLPVKGLDLTSFLPDIPQKPHTIHHYARLLWVFCGKSTTGSRTPESNGETATNSYRDTMKTEYSLTILRLSCIIPAFRKISDQCKVHAKHGHIASARGFI